MILSVLTTVQQWILFTATTVAVGCVAWKWVVAPGAARILGSAGGELAAVERWVVSVGWITALGLVVAWALRMVVQVMGFRDPFVPLWEDVSFLLFETFWGTVWMAQGVTVLLLAAAFGSTRAFPEASWRLATAFVLVLVATLALSSHAMGVDAGRPFFVAADAIHALAAGSWIGSLGVILLGGRLGGPTEQGRGLFAAQLRAFSPMALVSMSALLSMGVVLAWTHLDGIANLWRTSYGWTLSAKIVVAGAVFVVGFLNWRRGLPVADTAEGAVSLRRGATREVYVAAGVLLLTAVLVHMPKP